MYFLLKWAVAKACTQTGEIKLDVLFPGPFKLGNGIVGSSKVLLNVAIFLKWKSN